MKNLTSYGLEMLSTVELRSHLKPWIDEIYNLTKRVAYAIPKNFNLNNQYVRTALGFTPAGPVFALRKHSENARKQNIRIPLSQKILMASTTSGLQVASIGGIHFGRTLPVPFDSIVTVGSLFAYLLGSSSSCTALDAAYEELE